MVTSEIDVHCERKDVGCSWIGKISEYEVNEIHIRSCTPICNKNRIILAEDHRSYMLLKQFTRVGD